MTCSTLPQKLVQKKDIVAKPGAASESVPALNLRSYAHKKGCSSLRTCKK
jgi:hypothetical protein